MIRTATVRKCRKNEMDPDKPKSEQVWCVLTKDESRVLGRHPTKDKADKQLSAIEISKHGWKYRLRKVIGYLLGMGNCDTYNITLK